MNNSYDNFKVNAIFRDQPHYTYYSESFSETDPLYLDIYDIDKFFLDPEQLNNKLPLYENVTVRDPRTKKDVEKLIYDHTKPMKTPIFHSTSTKSCINYSDHVLGVKVIKQLQDCVPNNEDDITIWRLCERIRLKENGCFQKYVYDCNEKTKCQMIPLMYHLTDLYKQWYCKQCHILKTCHNAEKYTTYLGMPHPKLYKMPSDENAIAAEIQNVEIMKREGYILNAVNDKTLDFQSMKYNIEYYHNEYINCQKSKEESAAKLKSHFFNDLSSENANVPIFYIPLDALMFLLMTGDYMDLPTEMLLEIKQNEKSQKLIIMEKPLPARHCGWHTNKQVIEQTALALLSLRDEQKWYILNNGQAHEVLRTTLEINGNANKSECINYKLVTVEEYAATCMGKLSTIEKCNWLNALTKWNLQTSNIDDNLRIYTPLDYLAALSSNNNDDKEVFITNNLNIISLKLEYKALFGCEIMTKYELLREWFRLKLSKTYSTIHYRLDINNYDTIAEEVLTCERIEMQLFQLYQIKMINILSGLRECLMLLVQIPNGHYMMRYNSKFPQKLLLCQTGEETTKSTIHLHQLLQTEPSNLMFMSNENYLPIATDICSRMHLEHNQLPCTFRPCRKRKRNHGRTSSVSPMKIQKQKQQRQRQRQQSQRYDDRTIMLQRIQRNKTAQEKVKKYQRRIQKRLKRKQRKKSKKQIIDEKQHEEKLLQEEINRDQLLFSDWFTNSDQQISSETM